MCDERLAKNAYLDAYLASALRYLPFGEDAKFALSAERDRHLAAARRYVVDGVREAAPIWLRPGARKTGAEQPPENPAPGPA